MRGTCGEMAVVAGRFTTGFGILGVLLAPLSTSRADIIHLRGGEKLIGRILSDEKTRVVIQSHALGRIEIARERIERVEFDPPTELPPKAPPSDGPFVPQPPRVGEAPPAVPPEGSATNAVVKRRWYWPFSPFLEEPSTDWIQLKSGEWLRGTLHGMQNRTLEFESDELDELSFDWKDVHQVIVPQALVSYGDRQSAWGSLRIDRERVTVTGVEDVTFPRFELVGIAPGSPRELDYWSGRLSVGLNLRTGNTEQADLVMKARLDRRTPITHFELEYTGNFSEVENVETVNNQRVSETFDIFLTRRLFVRVPQSEYYHDTFQNIDARITAGGGVGYYLIDKPRTEWLVAGGPAYQHIRFDTVQPGEPESQSTPAALLQSRFEIELTKRVDFELDYQVIVAEQDSGGATHHAVATLEVDLTKRLDLDVSFIWDRIGNPQPDASGAVPEKDDLRLNLSLGVSF